MSGLDLAKFREALDKVKTDVGVLQKHQLMVLEDPVDDESKGEIPLLDLTEEPVKKKKKKGEKKGKGKKERPNSDEERKKEKRARKKAEKKERKKAMIESLIDNKKSEAAIRARVVGASMSWPSTTAGQDRLERRETPNVEKAAEDVATGSGTHDFCA
ncbi:UPF0329 protein ECU05_1680/ECU11_0050-like [Capsicum annuum]|uniref:UPF0329 protein ECU05_1680/ECU11_0050-like n=1 Tax=Capsicum annuum TaxID=4072 RepID=UPI0007BF0716|nr:UPF0329 protein ECU05_1680/ECU11_0050-like [Capsicum annuum]